MATKAERKIYDAICDAVDDGLSKVKMPRGAQDEYRVRRIAKEVIDYIELHYEPSLVRSGR